MLLNFIHQTSICMEQLFFVNHGFESAGLLLTLNNQKPICRVIYKVQGDLVVRVQVNFELRFWIFNCVRSGHPC